LIAQARRAADAADGVEQASQDDGDLDFLDALDGMSALYHEHYDALLRWPWKLFCAKWARALRISEEQGRERRRREDERQTQEALRALREAHQG
jgi:hypothetical protein